MAEKLKILPFPEHYDHRRAYDPSYQANPAMLMKAAEAWCKEHQIYPFYTSRRPVYVLNIDDQGDFVSPTGSLFVAGRNGSGAMDALRRRTEFQYRYLNYITRIINTMDSHLPYQVFFPSAHLDKSGQHPAPYTLIMGGDEYRERYEANPVMANQLGFNPDWLDRQFEFYCEELKRKGNQPLCIWPYHCLLGSPGHRLVGLAEEVRLFHSFARGSANTPELKGMLPLTEHYGIFGPEVTHTWEGDEIEGVNDYLPLIQHIGYTLSQGGLLFIIGEAASHCRSRSIWGLVEGLRSVDWFLAEKLIKQIVVLKDCSTPVVVSGVVDYTDMVEKDEEKMREAGIHVIDSTDHARIEELILG